MADGFGQQTSQLSSLTQSYQDNSRRIKGIL